MTKSLTNTDTNVILIHHSWDVWARFATTWVCVEKSKPGRFRAQCLSDKPQREKNAGPTSDESQNAGREKGCLEG
jgi:hypothetical protein